MKKLVIFDMDGLMFDSEKIVGDCLIRAGKHYGYDITFETRLELLGKNKQTNEIFLKKKFGQDFPIEEIRKMCETLKNEWIKENGMPMKKGLVELLNYLKEKKVFTVIASSSSKDVIKHYITLNHIEGYFNCIVSGDEVSRCKPDPEIFLKACKEFDVAPKDAIVLEDSTSGILAAFHGDIDVICVPDLIIPDKKYLSCALLCAKNLIEVKDYMIENGIL